MRTKEGVPPLPRRLALILLVLTGQWLHAQREDPMTRFEERTQAYQKLWRGGEYAESLNLLVEAIESSNEVPLLWLYDRADLYFAVGNIDKAINEIEWLHYRRPSPKSALQLALYYRARGNRRESRRVLDQAAERYKRFRGGVDETDNALAMIQIKELLGENPRSLFQDILNVEEREEENTIKRFLAAGNLAWRKFDFQLASEYYNKILDLEEDNVEAFIGLAECYWKSGDPRLGEMIDAVLAINPHNPRILAIQAEMHLENDRFDEALKLIEQVLTFNPNHLRFLGLKSAAYFLQDRITDMQLVQQQALLFNEYASEVFRITGRIASRKYRFKEAADFQKHAMNLDPDDDLARAYYAFDLLRMGQDKQGYDELRKSFEANRFNVHVFNMLELMDKVKDFEVIEKGPFRIQIPKRERQVWGDDALALLEEAYQKLEKKYQVKLQVPVSVQIFDQHDDFMVRSLGLPGMVGFLGICFGQLITMDAPSARTKGTMNWQATLWHEFVHVITLQKTNNRIPRWLSEGISVYEEWLRQPAWAQLLDPGYQPILDEDGLPGLADLEPYLTQPKSTTHVMFGYFVAGEFVRFYVENYGLDALLTSLDAMAEGKPANAALLNATGKAGKSMDKDFGEFLADRVHKLKNLESPGGSMQMFSKGGSQGPAQDSPFVEALNAGQSALNGNDWQLAEEQFEKARDLFPEYTGQDGPRAQLAKLYEQQGKREDLIALHEETLALDATSYQSCIALARLYREDGQWDKLRDAAHTGLTIDPFDVSLRRDYQHALVQSGRREAGLSQLEQLIQLDATRSVDYRLQRLDLLISLGRKQVARNEALKLLEEVPYSWEAQKRLLTIVEPSGGN